MENKKDDNQEHPMWLPPGADFGAREDEDEYYFGSDLDEHFVIPPRLEDKSAQLVEAVNDFHFAMMNDVERNQFYRTVLAKNVKPGDIVVEIGTGSGLLAMLAAKCGAKHVYAIEANRHLAALATHLISVNGLDKKITVINKLSTEVAVGKDIPQKADVVVSEILGTLLLGENALQYVADVRRRLLKPGAPILPHSGKQFISLVQCPRIREITSVHGWDDLDLRGFNSLRDTVSLVFTKQYGFRFSDLESTTLVSKTPVLEVDFTTDSVGTPDMEKVISVIAEEDGIVDAVLTYWEAYGEEEEENVMSTEPAATRNNFARDMQWGQALQLLNDPDESTGLKPFKVKKGDKLDIIVRLSSDSAVMQFEVIKDD